MPLIGSGFSSTFSGGGGGGGGSTSWSSLTAPTANLSLSMGGYSTALTYGAATGSSNLFALADSASNTGTGALLRVATASGSAAKTAEFQVRATNGLQIGWNSTQSWPSLIVGSTTATFSQIYGIISFGSSGNDRSQAILLNDSLNYRAGLGFASNELRFFNTYVSGFKVSFGGITSGTSTYNECAYIETTASGWFAITGARSLRLYDSDNSHYAGWKPATTTTTSYLVELPAAPPSSSNSVIAINSSAVASFSSTPSLDKLALNTTTFGTASRFQLNAPTTAVNDSVAVIATGATGNKGLVVQGAAGQTANLQEWQNSSGTARAYIAPNAAGFVIDGTVTVGATAWVNFNGRSQIFSPADGQIRLANAADSAFDRLILGVASSSFPAIKRSGSGVQIRLGDDTDYSALTVGSIAAATATGSTATVASVTENISLTGTTTDSAADLLPANSLILAVVTRVTTTITGASAWELGDAGLSSRFLSATTALTAGSTVIGLNHQQGSVSTDAAGAVQSSSAKLRITTTGVPTGGSIRVTVYYLQLVPPTS